jgi:hypothetical protein
MWVWKTNLVLEDLESQKQTKMWPKWEPSWDLIDVWQSEWSVVSWIWITELSTTFWPRNWGYGKFVQSWFQRTSWTNKTKTEGMYTWTFLNASKITKIT